MGEDLRFCQILDGLEKICWPTKIFSYSREPEFNKHELPGIFQSILGKECVQIKDTSRLRIRDAHSFFGWPSKSPDITFKFIDVDFAVENKIIKGMNPKSGYADEYNIGNSFVQGASHLNSYDISLVIVLIFDSGRGKDYDWDHGNERKLINVFTNNYPIFAARVRQDCLTKVYYNNKYRIN